MGRDGCSGASADTARRAARPLARNRDGRRPRQSVSVHCSVRPSLGIFLGVATLLSGRDRRENNSGPDKTMRGVALSQLWSAECAHAGVGRSTGKTETESLCRCTGVLAVFKMSWTSTSSKQGRISVNEALHEILYEYVTDQSGDEGHAGRTVCTSPARKYDPLRGARIPRILVGSTDARSNARAVPSGVCSGVLPLGSLE